MKHRQEQLSSPVGGGNVWSIVEIIGAVLESLLAFLIRLGLWFFIASFAPTWVAVLALIVIVLIPVSKVAFDDISYFYQPAADLALALVAVLSIHQFLNWKGSLALTALFAIPLVWNEYV